MKSNRKLKVTPRSERAVKKERVYSLNFEENMKLSGIKCFVPWEDYLSLKKRYVKMFERYRKMKESKYE